jgi:hypothetical protein
MRTHIGLLAGVLATLGLACGSGGNGNTVKSDGGADGRATDSAVAVDMAVGSDSAPGADRAADVTAAIDTPAGDRSTTDQAAPRDMMGADRAPDSSATDATSSGTCNIPCFAGVAEQCVPTGSCMQQFSGTTANVCYMNGVKILSTITGFAPPTTATKVTKVDGTSTCYTADTVTTGAGTASAMTTVTYKNAGGTTFATGVVNGTTTMITCTGSGVTYDLARDCPSTQGSASCTNGTCAP